MSQKVFNDSNFRFSDPVRFFKANDPYYFEIDNIPLKQLQENCLWLRDQLRSDADSLRSVKRADIDELRPYASGGDRQIKVMPGRYTARVNDASQREPLAFLEKVMGANTGEVDVWNAATPNPGNFPEGKNAILEASLEKFKSSLAGASLSLNGLTDRAFTWPVVNSDFPVNLTGAVMSGFSYGDGTINIPGGSAQYSPTVIQQAMLWAKSRNSETSSFALPTFEFTNSTGGFAKLPRTEAFFVKAWRGVARTAIVDVADELSVEVPSFDATDFNYIDINGDEQSVDGVESRIDMVFIYSKPVDATFVNVHTPTGPQAITTPTLGIVRGAGIKVRFDETNNPSYDYKTDIGNEHKIVGSPGDARNENLGFSAASGNDIAYDVRGSFPAPDDILNVAPLISERLQENALELVGQSILPVAYVWVQNGSQVVLDTDVIDIRPMFRTAELAYNERAGIAAAFPQLSLANPAVGKAQMDHEVKRVYDDVNSRVSLLESNTGPADSFSTVATGYVFGGYNFGPEGAMFDHYQTVFGQDGDSSNDSETYIKNYIRTRYGFGSSNNSFDIPIYPDWDFANWRQFAGPFTNPSGGLLDQAGSYVGCNDYINTFYSQRFGTQTDSSITGGSRTGVVTMAGTDINGDPAPRKKDFKNGDGEVNMPSAAGFHYISKKIRFNRPSWMIDYIVDVDFINCLAQNYSGGNQYDQAPISYFGHWVEKGVDEFTIYIAFNGRHMNYQGQSRTRFIAPYTNVNGVTVSDRVSGEFSSFAVVTSDLLYTNENPVINGENIGYQGSPRIGVCTYPTISWKMTGIPQADVQFHYPNLGGLNPTIDLKSS